MKLLLDTHTFLWHAEGSPQLSPTAATLLTDPANDLYLSTATLWEIAIKLGLGKLALSTSLTDFTKKAIAGYGHTVLPITIEDCTDYSTLPFPLAAHRDPFDRMIIVQARRNGAAIVGSDAHFDAYGISRIW